MCIRDRALAARVDGTVIGHYPRPGMTALNFADGAGAAIVYEQELKRIEEAASQAKAEFDATVSGAKVPVTWSTDDRVPLEGLRSVARYSDLVLVGFHEPDDPNAPGYGLGADLAIDSGLPVLLTPAKGLADGFPGRVMIGWNGSRESGRAVRERVCRSWPRPRRLRS